MKSLLLLLATITFSAGIYAQPVAPPKKLEEFKKYIGMDFSAVEKLLEKADYTSDETDVLGNFKEDAFVSEDDDIENDILIQYIGSKVEGVGSSDLTYAEYRKILDELQKENYTITHQKVQLTGNQYWRSDVWKSHDGRWKCYINYYKDYYNVKLTTAKINYGSREDKATGQWFNPIYTNFVAVKNAAGKSIRHKAECSHKSIATGEDMTGVFLSPGMSVIVYSKALYDGEEWQINTNQNSLPAKWMNNVKSFEVLDLLVECGTSSYDDVDLTLGSREPKAEHDITSFNIEEGLKFIVFDREDFKGNSKVFTASNTDIGSWKGKIKSYMVEQDVNSKKKPELMSQLSQQLNKLKGIAIPNHVDSKILAIKEVQVKEVNGQLECKYILDHPDNDTYYVYAKFMPSGIQSIQEVSSDVTSTRKIKITMDKSGAYNYSHYQTKGSGKTTSPNGTSFTMYFPASLDFSTIKTMLEELKTAF